MLEQAFFARPAPQVARELLGKVLRRRHGEHWLAARVVETEAYERREKASHASLGRTPSREPLFMASGTIYMYFSRAGDSFNVSAGELGDAGLIKAGHVHVDAHSPESCARLMGRLNPRRDGGERVRSKLCAGQTLLARALDLRVREWSGRPFDRDELWIEDAALVVPSVLVTPRLGIPEGRDEGLFHRFVDEAFASSATRNPLTRRCALEGVSYRRLTSAE